LNAAERRAYESVGRACNDVLRNKSGKYVEIVEYPLSSDRAVGCNMSLKLNFLQSHVDFFFQGNMGSASDDHSERFHQDISRVGKRFCGKLNPNMLADYYCTEDTNRRDKRKENKTSF